MLPSVGLQVLEFLSLHQDIILQIKRKDLCILWHIDGDNIQLGIFTTHGNTSMSRYKTDVSTMQIPNEI